MTDNITFREAPPAVEQPKPDIPTPEADKGRPGEAPNDTEPVELRDKGGSIVLEVLNINEEVNNLPAEDRANLHEVKDYVLEIVKSKGLPPNVSAFAKTLNGLKSEMGLDDEAEPSIVLDRIAGVVKAWRNLSFVKDPMEKRKIFFKLANLKSSKDMNEAVYKMMENYEVWN